MFDPEIFIESLFEDTTQSTLIFELIEGITTLIPYLYDELISYLPQPIASSCSRFEEGCILSPVLLQTKFEQNTFEIMFKLPCELNIFAGNKIVGTLHIVFLAHAHFILRNEGGSEIITSKTPPTSYDNYSPDHLEFSSFTFDQETVQYISAPPKKYWWPFR